MAVSNWSYFKNIQINMLVISGFELITNAGLTLLQHLPLQYLNVDVRDPITEEGLACLQHIPNLINYIAWSGHQ